MTTGGARVLYGFLACAWLATAQPATQTNSIGMEFVPGAHATRGAIARSGPRRPAQRPATTRSAISSEYSGERSCASPPKCESRSERSTAPLLGFSHATR